MFKIRGGGGTISNQSGENAGVAFVEGVNGRFFFFCFEKINKH